MKIESGKGLVERTAWALLVLFVFTVPWEKSVWVQGVGTFASLLGMAAFAVGAVAAIRRRAFRGPNLVLALAALFVLWSGATYLWSYDPGTTLRRALTLAELWAMAWLIWESCRTAARQRRLLQAYVAGAVAGAAITFVRYALHQQTYWRRYAATGFDPNDFGLILALAMPLALYLALTARGWSAWIWRGAALVVALAVLLTGSRTGLIATWVGLALAVWTWRAADWRQRISAAALAAVLALGMVEVTPSMQKNRLATIPAELGRGTFHGRSRIWKSGLRAYKARPIRGVGAGAYPEAVRPWLGGPALGRFRYVAHNTFLSVLVETGIVGFALYGALLAAAAIFVWTLAGAERALWSVALLVWLVGVSTLTWEHYKPTWLLLALITTGWARAYRSGAGAP